MNELLLLALNEILQFIIIYGVGSILWYSLLINKNLGNSLRFFGKLFLGLLGISTIWGLIMTKGLSIQIGIALIFITSLAFKAKTQPARKFKIHIEVTHLLISVGLLILILIFQTLRNQFFDPDLIYFSDIDYGIYSAVADYLNITGAEISSPWYTLTTEGADAVPKPYHYGDLWILAWMIKSKISISPLSIYIYCYIPILTVAAFWGNFALLNRYGSKIRQAWPFLVLTFFLTFYNPFYPNLAWTSGYMICSVFLSPKVVVFYLPLVAGLLLIRRKEFFAAAIVLCLIPIQNILFAPIVFTGVFVWSVINLGKNRRKLKNALPFVYSMFMTILAAGVIVSFYLVFGSFKNSSDNISLGIGEYLFRFFRGIGGATIKYSVFNLPFLILLFFLIKKWRDLDSYIKHALILLLILFITAILTKAALNMNAEVSQFFNLVANPLTTAALFLSLSSLHKLYEDNAKVLRWYRFIIVYLLIVPFVMVALVYTQRDSAVSRDFLEAFSLKKKELPNNLGAAIADREKITVYSEDPRMCKFCNFIPATINGGWVQRIDTPDQLDNIKFPQRETAVALSPFFRYMKKLKATGQWKSHHQAQLDFLRRDQIRYIILEQGSVLPTPIMSLTDTILTDPYSGVKAVFLNPWN